jgi:HNH endonuclease
LPPKHVRTIRELIYWEYAKLVSGSAVGDRKNFRFVTYTYNRFKKNLIHPSSILTENKMLVESASDLCAYCNCHEELEWEHIIPKSRGGAESIDNMVLCCKKCNCSKSDRDPFEWYGIERRYELPRIVLGKYLKLVYEAHERSNTLDSSDLNTDGHVDIFDLGSIFK